MQPCVDSIALQRRQASRQRLATRLNGLRSEWPTGAALAAMLDAALSYMARGSAPMPPSRGDS